MFKGVLYSVETEVTITEEEILQFFGVNNHFENYNYRPQQHLFGLEITNNYILIDKRNIINLGTEKVTEVVNPRFSKYDASIPSEIQTEREKRHTRDILTNRNIFRYNKRLRKIAVATIDDKQLSQNVFDFDIFITVEEFVSSLNESLTNDKRKQLKKSIEKAVENRNDELLNIHLIVY